MAFTLFTPLFNKIDTATATFVSDISSNVIAAITPVVTVGLTLAFITFALLIIRGAVDMPVMEFLGRSVRIGIITSVALAGGLYQTQIASAIQSSPDDLAQALISSPTSGTTAASLIDGAAEKGFSKAQESFEKAGIFGENGIAYAVYGFIIMLATGVLVAIGGAFVLLSKIALGLLAGLGPLFILALLWQPTARFFEMWAAQVLNYGLLIVLFSAVFGLMMSIFTGYMEDLKFDGAMNLGYAIGGAVILAVAMILILLQLPSIASGLAGGVGLSYIWELRAVRGMASAGAGLVAPSDRRIGSRGRVRSGFLSLAGGGIVRRNVQPVAGRQRGGRRGLQRVSRRSARPGGGGCSEIHRRSIRNELGGKQDRCRCQDRSGLLQGPPDRKQESRVTQSVKAQRGVAAPFLRLKIAFLILNK